MGRVFLPQSQATPYTPTAGETFNEVVAKCDKVNPEITPDEVALFNWGATSTSEILRALVELVGCDEINPLDPFECKLNPAKGLKGKILLPKVWKKSGLAYETVHKLTVRKQLPATAIAITSLDAWFLPGEEYCGIFYQLEGIKDRAQLLDFDLYASNYCKATAKVTGDFVDYTYSPTPDVPIVQRSLSTAAIERESGEVEDWNGESEAASGVLTKRGDNTRYINAASSPYSVVLRYSKAAAKTAFVNLKSFWPRWTGDPGSRSLVQDSLKIQWTAKGCPGGLQGQIQLWDKDDVVWRQYLPSAKCGNGDQQFDLPDEAKALMQEDFMPYRVQLQLHTDKDTDNGFAIAAMHTEVRLFTHPDIGTFGDDHEQEPQVLPIGLAPYYAGTAPPDDSAKGRKLRLAKGGYHPGPVADGEGQAPYLQAVKEFQRDHTKPGGTDRLKADGTLDGPTKQAIASLAPGQRPLFADIAMDNVDSDDDANSLLNDNNTESVVWVDDRHNYTHTDATAAKYLLPNMGLEDYHGAMEGHDIKQAKDHAATCRPWIPLEVSLPVLRKTDILNGSAIPDVSDASRAAVGPIRVDWTFRDLDFEPNIDTTVYNSSRTRPLQYLNDTFQAIKGTHNGKDAWNCTTALGGIRGSDYYKAPFGVEVDNSLIPWKGMADAGVSAICSVTHDDLGQDAKLLFDTHLGKAGVYFHPSTIAGDGYQVRAQVSFRDLPSGSTHPNWQVLRQRYDMAKLAQSHTAPLRLWRKDTFRAHIPWAPADKLSWGSADVSMVAAFQPGMVQFEYEGGTSLSITPLTSLISEKDYLDLLGSTITGKMGANPKTDRYRPKGEMKFNDEYLWPWWDTTHFGILAVPPPNTEFSGYGSFLDNNITNDSWDDFSAPLILLLLARVESKHKLMRGHLISEFLTTPHYWKEIYLCSKCGTKQMLIELTEAGGSAVGEACRVMRCPGTLVEAARETYTCDVCGTQRIELISDGFEGKACTEPCVGTLSVLSSTPTADPATVSTVYQCNVCGRTKTVNEPAGGPNTLDGTVCGRQCTGHLHGDPATQLPKLMSHEATHLGLAAIGEPLGALWLMTEAGARSFWAHEVGHHKHLEHSAGAPGASLTQHDTADNSVDPALNPPNVVPAAEKKWDRDCVMSYVNTETGDDAAFFCGKCALKLRGWKVEGTGGAAGPNSGDQLTNPGAGVSGP